MCKWREINKYSGIIALIYQPLICEASIALSIYISLPIISEKKYTWRDRNILFRSNCGDPAAGFGEAVREGKLISF